MTKQLNKTPWYAAGLHFECMQCGACCSGPAEGYIWVSPREIEFMAEYLKLPVEKLRQRYLRRVGLRTTIIEHPQSKDCIFLGRDGGAKRCIIYPVRPAQCRRWPFWPDNLASPERWRQAGRKCPGINNGRLYSFEEIELIKNIKKWWQKEPPQTPDGKSAPRQQNNLAVES